MARVDVTASPLDVDNIISRLLDERVTNPRKSEINLLTQMEIRELCLATQEIFRQQPMFLELCAPIHVCGDIHGQYSDLITLFQRGSFPPAANYLFLGDYVDRGRKSLETVCLLFAYKVKYPENFFLLRGNHETSSVSRVYGFYDECKRRYTVKLWKTFTDCFAFMPVAALIDDRIFCCHGGLSQEMSSFHDILQLPRLTEIPAEGLLCDLLWADPERGLQGFVPSDRGVSYVFGEDVVRAFVQCFDVDLICRAHQVVEDGYEFFARRKMVTVFSAPHYCGEFDNAAAILTIGEDLTCSFTILRPNRSIRGDESYNTRIAYERQRSQESDSMTNSDAKPLPTQTVYPAVLYPDIVTSD